MNEDNWYPIALIVVLFLLGLNMLFAALWCFQVTAPMGGLAAPGEKKN